MPTGGPTCWTGVDLSLSTRLIDARRHEPIGDDIPAVSVNASFSPDSETMATSYPGATVLWTLDPKMWRKRACEIAGRNLTEPEVRQYLPESSDSSATCRQYPAP